jgi:hypothetical protein
MINEEVLIALSNQINHRTFKLIAVEVLIAFGNHN